MEFSERLLCPQASPSRRQSLLEENLSRIDAVDETEETSSNSCSSGSFVESSNDGGATQPDLRRSGVVFDNYNKVGSDLMHNINCFENNNLHLSKEVTRLQQKVVLLKQKRDLQQTSLVELQIKAEKLDRMRQTAVEECLVDRSKLLKYLNDEMSALSRNDQHFGDVLKKLLVLLADDKESLSGFSNDILLQHEVQITTSKNYIEGMNDLSATYHDRISASVIEDNSINDELVDALHQFRSNLGVKEKHEHELQEKFTNLKVVEDELTDLKLKIDNWRAQMTEIAVESEKLRNDCEQSTLDNAHELKRKEECYETLVLDLKAKTAELNKNESKLSSIIEEKNSLVNQISDLEGQIKMMTVEMSDLNHKIDITNKNIDHSKLVIKGHEDIIFQLSGMHKLENETITKKNDVSENLSTKCLLSKELGKNVVALDEKWLMALSKLEHLKKIEDDAKMENSRLLQNKEKLAAVLAEDVETSHGKEIQNKVMEGKHRRNGVGLEVKSAEERLRLVQLGINTLEEEKGAMEKDVAKVREMEGNALRNQTHFREEKDKLKGVKIKIAALREETRRLKAAREFNLNVENLKSEARKINEEIEEVKEKHEAQKQGFKYSSARTLSNLQDQIEQLKKVTDEEIRRRQVRIDNFKSIIPLHQRDIANHKKELAELTKKNIAMMRDRLKNTARLIEGYKALQARLQNKPDTDFTTVRLVGTIEEHLSTSFRGMCDYMKMPTKDLSSPSYSIYRRALDAFENRFESMISEGSSDLTDLPFLADLKTAAISLFGLRRYGDTVNGSDSTFLSPTGSSFLEF